MATLFDDVESPTMPSPLRNNNIMEDGISSSSAAGNNIEMVVEKTPLGRSDSSYDTWASEDDDDVEIQESAASCTNDDVEIQESASSYTNHDNEDDDGNWSIAASDSSSTEGGESSRITTTSTKHDILCDFNGSIPFVIGSSGFILSLYRANWLPYFRFGCIIWIWGCASYSIPILLKLYYHHQKGCCGSFRPWDLGDVGCLLSMAFFITGCILGGFYDELQVLEWIVPINYLFCLGSFALAMEPLYAIYCYCRDMSCYCTCKSDSLLCGSRQLYPNNKRGGKGDGLVIKLTYDRLLELLGIASFCVAGIFGGFGPSDVAVTVGMYHWGIGSILCFARSCLMWYTNRRSKQRVIQKVKKEEEHQNSEESVP